MATKKFIVRATKWAYAGPSTGAEDYEESFLDRKAAMKQGALIQGFIKKQRRLSKDVKISDAEKKYWKGKPVFWYSYKGIFMETKL